MSVHGKHLEQHMDGMLRRIEFMSGFASGVFAVLGGTYAVVGPAYRYVVSTVDSGVTCVIGSLTQPRSGAAERPYE
ncbi:MAG TPA: hypothetical protein VGZ23_05025 [bacterium]|nr:hypothetical protein [bacterium]